MSTRILLALFGALLILRLPSLVQPMGPDQGLYAYVGERIRHGELAYRDAWDQKPPGIHYVYAALGAVSDRDAVVPAVDLLAGAITAALLWLLGSRVAGPSAGAWSALLFLLLSDPGLTRLGGARVRAQAETFIALAVTAAVAVVVRQGATGSRRSPALVLAGVLLGAAFSLKYNAGLYVLVVMLALLLVRALKPTDILWLTLGWLAVPLALLTTFWRGAALNDLYQATIAYNVLYSGQTYSGRWDMVRYLVTLPLQHARVDALWFVGGLGCVVLTAAGFRRRLLWLPLAWVGVACFSIAINGSRNLPQYFVQAAPALALAAGAAAAIGLPSLPRLPRWIALAVVATGVWRAGADPFPTLAANVRHDAQYLFGHIDRRTHLARYGGARDTDKYSALDNQDIGAFLAAKTTPDETVYVFGFSPASYVYAHRRSASRFFWSRPVILDFHGQDPDYGVAGLRRDLERNRPAYLVLQQHDWAPDVQDSAPFFLSQPILSDWLRGGYHQVPFIDGFDAWERNGR